MSSYGEKPDRETLDEAAAWVIREDRGLSAGEQDRLSQWVAADPTHREAWARQRRNWRRLEPLARWLPEHSAEPNPDLLAPSRRARAWVRPALTLAASVTLMATWLTWRENPPVAAPPPAAAVIVREASATRRVLEDGSVVELNRGAEFNVRFSAMERRIELGRGEPEELVARAQRFSSTVSQLMARYGGRGLEAVDLRYPNGYAVRMHGVKTATDDKAAAALAARIRKKK